MSKKTISTKTRRAVYERDGYACILCRNENVLHLHHVTSLAQGGSSDETNLVTLCPYCHAVLHGLAVKSYDFPFDEETAFDAVFHYLYYTYPLDEDYPG